MSTNRIVFITGVSRGLGRAMVDEFVQRGWTVVGCSRSGNVLGTLQKQNPAPHYFATADMADDVSVGEFVTKAIETVGSPDLLLNNAAVVNHNAPLWEVSAEEFGQLIDINIKGVHSMIRHCAPAMIEANKGIIINFSSGWGRSTSPEVAPYCASKWAMEGLSSALAQELPSGMAAAALNPGIINTEMLQRCFGAGAEGYPDAKEWAKTAVPFLAQLNHHCNGQALTAP